MWRRCRGGSAAAAAAAAAAGATPNTCGGGGRVVVGAAAAAVRVRVGRREKGVGWKARRREGEGALRKAGLDAAKNRQAQ